MRFFLDCKKEISFYMKELTLFELDERNFPNCGNCLSALFLSYRVLFHSHSDHLPILWQMYIFLSPWEERSEAFPQGVQLIFLFFICTSTSTPKPTGFIWGGGGGLRQKSSLNLMKLIYIKVHVYIYLWRDFIISKKKSYGFKNLVKLGVMKKNFKITAGRTIFRKLTPNLTITSRKLESNFGRCSF